MAIPAYADDTVTLYQGDCIEVLRMLEANSIDACVTDPPYLLNFMGKDFDTQHQKLPGANEGQQMQAWHLAWATEVLRVLKPGGYCLAMGGTRTVHRLTSALEDAGFEVRDQLMYLYGSGWPKSTNISKAIDKEAGMEREVIGPSPFASLVPNGGNRKPLVYQQDTRPVGGLPVTAPATDAAKEWDGWGSALKPAVENIIVAQKPNPPLTQEHLFSMMSIVNYQLLLEIILCEAQLPFTANNAESHLTHLAQRSKGAVENTALRHAWDCPNEGELMPFVISVAQHLNDMRAGLAKMNLGIAQESVKRLSSERSSESLTLVGAAADLSALMAMLLSELEAHIDLSMISLWNNTLEDALNLLSRFTTSTTFGAITVLRTLNWSLSQSISESITQLKSAQINGLPSLASVVAALLNDARQSLSSILAPIVVAHASEERERFVPNYEPIVLCRKPLEGTLAQNVQRWGAGALHIDMCRIPAFGETLGEPHIGSTQDGWDRPWKHDAEAVTTHLQSQREKIAHAEVLGRWPANILTDGSDAIRAMFPETSSNGTAAHHADRGKDVGRLGAFAGRQREQDWPADTGSAARFFAVCPPDEPTQRFLYTSKVSSEERGSSIHPTQKPLSLLTWLLNLVTRPGALVLDPFLGSATTAVACARLGRRCIGIERESEYMKIACERMQKQRYQEQQPLF